MKSGLSAGRRTMSNLTDNGVDYTHRVLYAPPTSNLQGIQSRFYSQDRRYTISVPEAGPQTLRRTRRIVLVHSLIYIWKERHPTCNPSTLSHPVISRYCL